MESFAITNTEQSTAESHRCRDPKLLAACQEFETTLTAMLLKEGLTSSAQGWGDEEGSSNGYLEMAYDQMAVHLGKQGILGIADILYEQLTSSHDHRTGEIEPSGTN